MTQPEEVPAEPVPDQPAQTTESTHPAEPDQTVEPAQTTEFVRTTEAAEAAEPAQSAEFARAAQAGEAAPPSDGAAPMWGQPAAPIPAPVPGGDGSAPPVVPVLSPEEQAAVAAKKAKRRSLFAKSAILAVPGVVLVSLLVVTSMQVSTLSAKTTSASTAAKSANAAGGLTAQLRAAQSAAEASILVDAGCVAVESQTTANVEDKLLSATDALAKAEDGNSFSAFATAADDYVNDLQSLSTDLQQDAALSKRAGLKTAIGAITSDLRVVISTMQDNLAGNFSTSGEEKFNAAANRMDGDATAVDTMCGGTTLDGGTSSGGSSGSSGTTNA